MAVRQPLRKTTPSSRHALARIESLELTRAACAYLQGASSNCCTREMGRAACEMSAKVRHTQRVLTAARYTLWRTGQRVQVGYSVPSLCCAALMLGPQQQKVRWFVQRRGLQPTFVIETSLATATHRQNISLKIYSNRNHQISDKSESEHEHTRKA